MRQFRGKRVDNDEWVYGSYIHFKSVVNKLRLDINSIMELTGLKFEVIPQTVGQFTGLLDKNGTKIFEGDILDNNHVVTFETENACYYARRVPLCMSNSHREVIGNIHTKQLLTNETK